MPHQPLHLDLGTRLLLQAKHGNRPAFDQVCHLYYRVVRSFLAGHNGFLSYHDREDMVQEVFLRAWARRARFQGDSTAKTYLLGIARNVALECQRGKPTATLSDDQEMTPDTIAHALDRRERARTVHHAVQNLPPKQQEAITLVYLEQLEPSEAADKANCPTRVLYWRLADARITLRRLLGDLGAD